MASVSPPLEKAFADAPADVREAIRERPWRGALEPCGEIAPYVASDMTGSLPKDLQGTFYVNGPGRIRVGDKRYGHWFDGDGQVTSFQVDGSKGTVVVTSTVVRTPRVLAQEAAGPKAGFAMRSAWTQAASWHNNLFKTPSNPSNTSVLVWGGKLYALCEGGDPFELDPVTLESKGFRRFDPSLPMGFSAHFKIDARGGDEQRTLYNFGFGARGAGLFDAFALSEEGKLLRRGNLPLPWNDLAFIHDCAMSEHYLTLFVPAYKADGLDLLSGALGCSPFGWKLKWKDDRPTRVIIVRKADMSVAADLTIPSISMYHFGGAFEEGSKLHVLSLKLVGTREGLERNFGDMYAAHFTVEHSNTLHEYVFDMADGGRLVSERAVMPEGSGAAPGEFFVMNPKYQMKKPRFMYMLANAGDSGYLDALQKWDLEAGTTQTRLIAGRNLAEALFVPRAGATEEDDGYLIYNEYDTATHRTNFTVLSARDIEGEPLCAVNLPHHVPYTFHGFWQPAGGAASATR